ncbi:MAG: flavodoxin domain-containing protein [Gaiellaceae bacterium]|jgi:menaquinone-dependent protoporphyrinogen oxidase
MAGLVLVAYATKRGSTREVAEAIAATLREQGFDVSVEPAGKVRKDIERFDGVMIGGALYSGRWHHHALRLLKRLRKLPATKPVAVFGMGPRRTAEIAFERASKQLHRALAKVPEVEPVAVGVFGGADAKKGVDIRDWDAIRVWAEEVGEAIGSVGAPPAV